MRRVRRSRQYRFYGFGAGGFPWQVCPLAGSRRRRAWRAQVVEIPGKKMEVIVRT